ncbi:MAG: MT-A70 family methyltransferase [Rhodocyclaceae bacterium]
MTWPFAELRPLSFGAIIADPPWKFELYSEKGIGKAPQAQYACMELDEIRALPVQQLASRHCVLGLWATSPMLPDQLDVMKCWGFRYCGFIAWGKMTRRGKINVGGGYRLRSSAELLLVGTLGDPPRNHAVVRNLVLSQERGHSRKPDEQYDIMEALAPGQLCAELFARQRIGRPHWFHWGNEVGKFAAAGETERAA